MKDYGNQRNIGTGIGTPDTGAGRKERTAGEGNSQTHPQMPGPGAILQGDCSEAEGLSAPGHECTRTGGGVQSACAETAGRGRNEGAGRPDALNYANDTLPGDNPAVSYATVYPLSMFSRVIIAQIILMLFL